MKKRAAVILLIITVLFAHHIIFGQSKAETITIELGNRERKPCADL